MDEHKLLEEIKQSAEDLAIPDSLQPDRMQEKLTGLEKPKRKRFSPYHMAGAAAVILITLIALWQFPSLAPKEEPKRTSALHPITSYDEIYAALSQYQNSSNLSFSNGMDLKGEIAVPKAGSLDTGSDSAKELASPESADSFAQTNIQEFGVDEGDIVRTDGTHIYIMDTSGSLRIIEAAKGEMRLISTIQIPGLNERLEEMYLDGNTLSLIASGSDTALSEDTSNTYHMDSITYTSLYTYDLTDRRSPSLKGSTRQEGTYRTSRKAGSYIYLFSEYFPMLKEEREQSRYIPEINGKALSADDIYLPPALNNSSYLVITSVSIEKPDDIIDQKSIVSAANMFYVSQENIYICNNNWTNNRNMTQIMKFHYEDGKITATAAGEIPGTLNDAFSMNENEGFLRVVSTELSGNDSLNHLYILNPDLKVSGKIENLAPGETIQSARFFGNTGYFVTFRQMDPLFSADLSDPANPKLLGELKITGFSSYLHFYGEGQLLGIGNEVDPSTGAYKGIKLSMFDISDPVHVTETHKYVISDTYDCPGLYNYKAILVNPERNILGFECESTYMIFRYDAENGFQNLFAERLWDGDGYDYPHYARGLYIGQTFYLAKNRELKAYDMSQNFAPLNKLEF